MLCLRKSYIWLDQEQGRWSGLIARGNPLRDRIDYRASRAAEQTMEDNHISDQTIKDSDPLWTTNYKKTTNKQQPNNRQTTNKLTFQFKGF